MVAHARRHSPVRQSAPADCRLGVFFLWACATMMLKMQCPAATYLDTVLPVLQKASQLSQGSW